MPNRRILSLWFPRLAAERVLRRVGFDTPFAIVATQNTAQTIASICPLAEAEGITVGQSLAEARALCAHLITRPAKPTEEARFLDGLARWAGKFSPWVSVQKPNSLLIDISGCAHLFGGEDALADLIYHDCTKLRLSVHIGIADTVGAAWALARYSHATHLRHRSGDAIDQEARATRSRAVKRRNWERGGAAPQIAIHSNAPSIAARGKTADALADLPIAALRLGDGVPRKLSRLGLRRIKDLIELPRAALARRFGADVLRRLDQALDIEPEPVCPIGAQLHFATRLSLPDPIGLEGDIRAAIDRLLPPLCDKLRRAGRGARSLELSLTRTDQNLQILELRLAQATHDADRIIPLLHLQLPQIDPGFGIDMVRLEAHITEPLSPEQHSGAMVALEAAQTKRVEGASLSDLMSRLGARIGLDALTVLHAADSNIPEKTGVFQAAAYAPAAPVWPTPQTPRPSTMFVPEHVAVLTDGRPPKAFTWRRQRLELITARGPERIAPEWWLADPNWRTGTRDYWDVVTKNGARLWLFQALGGAVNGGWFCQGDFG